MAAITSLNSKGLSEDRKVFINELLERDGADVFFIQEHWLHKANLGDLRQIHKDYTATGCSGMPADKLHKKGRPYGGSGILYKKSISHNVKHIDSCKVKNACTITINENLLLVNAYLPTDNRLMNSVHPKFKETVDNLDGFLACHAGKSILAGGDLNVDLSRNNAHSRYIVQLAYRHNMYFVQTNHLANYEYTYAQDMRDGTNRKSTVDHFLLERRNGI